MRKRSVRGYTSAFLALVTAGLLGSCSVGVEAGTLDPQRLSGAHVDIGQMKIRNALVIAPAEGDGDAELVMTVVNDGTEADALLGVALAGPDGAVEVTSRPATVELPPETATVIPGETRPTITVEGGILTPGAYANATFTFENAGIQTVQLLVLSEAGVYGGN